MRFDTTFPVYVYVIVCVLIILSLALTWKRYFGQLRTSYLLAISGCRVLAVALLFIFALRPYSVDETPDKESFSIGVLTDVSGSMNSTDCDGESRLKTAKSILSEKSWFQEYETKYNLFHQTFSSRTFSMPEGELFSRAGGTNIEQAVDDMKKLVESGSLGGLILLTDGQENSGSVTEAAKALRDGKIPVTVVGIGGEKELEDLSVEFEAVPRTRRKNKEFELLVKVKKNTSSAVLKDLVLSTEDHEAGRVKVDLPAGKAEQIYTFKLREYTPGFKNYRVAIDAVEGEMVTSNNVDYCAVEINENEKIKVLFFSGNLSWEYKFLDKLCDDSENLHLTALIRTGPKAWYYYAGEEKKKFEVFPETEELIEYDVIVFDLGAEYLIGDEVAGNIEKFAFDKGGGLLFYGRLQENSKFSNLLPVTNLQMNAASGKKVIDVTDNSILVPRSKKDLTDLDNILTLKGGKMFFSSKVSSLKKSARPDLKLKGSSGEVIQSSLYYGSGRTSYLGVETWPWKMNPKNSGKEYAVFWKRTLTWLSSSSVQQLKILPAYRKYPAGEAMDLSIDLLDPNFEPSVTAKVEAVVKSPSGKIYNLKLPSSLDIEGRFGLDFLPEEVGEYSVNVKVEFADETKMSKKVSFLAAEASGENGTLPLNRRLLEDVTRITGGDYINWNEDGGDLKISERIPVNQNRTYHFNGPLTLALILIFFCAEWFLRRRIGLR